jgi:hypothetical protein
MATQQAAVTEDEMEGLSPEEIAAIQDDGDEELETEEDGETEDHVDDNLEEDLENTDETINKQEDLEAGAQAEEEPGDSEDETTVGTQDDFQPRYQAEAVEDYDGQMSSLNEKKDDLLKQFKDGDIDIGTYQSGRDEIDQSVRDLDKAQLKHEMSVEQNEQSAQQQWQWEQDRFFSNDKNTAYKDDPIISSAFDAVVKNLASVSENESKPMSWFLEEADRQVRAKFVVPGGDTTKTPKPPKRKEVDLSKVPPNLGDLASAEQPDITGNDEFSNLDKLSGMELETALSKLSQAEQDRYLKG